MTANFHRWEADPLFSAAEIVQDSADRMESVSRSLLHEQSLVHGNPADHKLLSSIEFHRRDLTTALGTTKWQLEDFERTVNLSALSNKIHVNDDNMSRHNQFIRAMREQILLLEQSLDDSSIGDGNKNMQWVNLDEQDRDQLAQFLSGGNSSDNASYSDTETIMKRHIDTNDTSGFSDKDEEIIELKIGEPPNIGEIMQVKMIGFGPASLPQFDSLKGNRLSKVDSQFHERLDFEALENRAQQSRGSLQGAPVDGEGVGSSTVSRAWDMETGCSAKGFFSKSKFRVSRIRLNVSGILGNLCNLDFLSGSKMARSFTKRRKDGETTDECTFDIECRPSSSSLVMSQVDQVKQTWMGLISTFSIFQRPHFEWLMNNMQPHILVGAFRRRLLRSQYFIQYNRSIIHVTSAIFVTLIFLGILAFHIA